MKRKIIYTGLGVASLIGLSACAKASEPFRDASVQGRNSDPAYVGEMPDGFSNFSYKCIGDTMVVVAFKGDDNRAAVATAVGASVCRTAG